MSNHQNSFQRLHGLRTVMLTSGLALLLAIVAIGVAQKSSDSTASAETHAQNPQSNAAEAKALLIAVQHYGFEPNELDVEEGRYLLVVQNHSGLTNLVVRLETDDGKKIYEDNAQQKRWRKRLDLKKGTYRLTAGDSPEWSTVIRVK